jgi:RNA polymerase sigma-70 factor (ECF subfamily)
VDYGGDDAQLEALASAQESTGTIAEHADILSRVDLGPALERAIGELPEVFRSAVVLVDVEGLAYNEAASVLGVPVGTIRSRLFRGRRLLQESLVMYARDAGLTTPAPCEV